MAQLLTNVFQTSALTQRVDQIAARIRPTLDPAETLRHERNVSFLKDRIERRVRSVTQQIADAEMPMVFDAAGEAKLTAWEFRRDAGSPSFGRPRGTQPTLQIAANGPRSYGTWRTNVLLSAGDYRMVGRVRTEDLNIGPDVEKGGVTLRKSGERQARMISQAPEWTELTYDFSVAGLTDIELLCELRASNGRAFFDVTSLKLVRKTAGSSK
jgi:hypothetical protein